MLQLVEGSSYILRQHSQNLLEMMPTLNSEPVSNFASICYILELLHWRTRRTPDAILFMNGCVAMDVGRSYCSLIQYAV
ncbi:hypothetical protein AKJ16_DCAP26380 [Drosera capensis]